MENDRADLRLPSAPYPIRDQMLIRKVANGWVIFLAGEVMNEFVHVATTPRELSEQVSEWAQAQLLLKRG